MRSPIAVKRRLRPGVPPLRTAPYRAPGVALALLGIALSFTAGAAQITRQTLAGVRYEQRLGSVVDRNLPFVDEAGRNVRLSDFLGSRPIFLSLVRYRCNMLCPEALNGFVRSIQELPLMAGRDYDWVVVSLDAGETPVEAAHKKQIYLSRDADDSGVRGWHFLVGRQSSIESLSDTVGCRVAYDPRTGSWAEPAGLVALSPSGRVCGYLFGADFESKDLARDLTLAKSGQTAAWNSGDQERCYPYDPSLNARSAVVLRVIRVGGGFSLLALVLLLGFLFWWERREMRGGRGIWRGEP